ncbi:MULTISPECIES: MFS transporter [Streptomyces]|uniref:Putative proline/betaine transporter n=1 Tax=Streptomyces venezuelae (strain ATCC 10712 / CBS 650.69 / DSM 40230 / JCM 4526 / NBRC 13096 / PD 04745) TaxID=953739 RepID=F2R7C0_STRVP|nr:MFS transporter [Streptomyces venezuelae]APE26074.1 MFS transporter [Streptomyces venezuelae]QES03423.1 MFS transporter [Streptomyces venezuelae ATCC 10712]CCA53812.1 L-Proline or Glycine betaine transporter ProP [Streptomyces venezuelae ATCC 10712]
MTQTLLPAPPTPRPLRQLLAASVGNAVEWYDWYAYTFLAAYIADQVFPKGSGNSLVPLLSTFAVFAVGFFMRPVGGLLLGALADRAGRRTALTATILLMGGSSLLVGLTPTYAAAGVLAPIVLVVARLLQGLSVGGEFAASTTFLVESAGPGRRGLFSSFQYVSTSAGQLAASGIAALLVGVLAEDRMDSWGWRVPFLLGAALSLAGFWIRRGAEETRSAAQREAPRPGLFDALRLHPRASLRIAGITAGGTLAYYTWTSYLPTYAELNTGIDKADALLAGTLSLAFFALLQPVGGLLSDRFGRKPALLFFGIGFALLAVPLLRALDGSFRMLLLVQCAGMVLLTGFTSISAAVNAELFPARVRAAGIGFPYSLTVALFGGTAPYLGTLFKELDRPGLFPWYVAALCLVSSAVYLRLPESAHKELER